MDAERNTAKISGLVDPNYCLRAIARCDGHAQLLWANLSHPKMRGGGSYGHYDYGALSPPYYDTYGESYGPRRTSLPEGMWHDYPTRSAFPPQYSYNNYLGYQYDHPPRIDYTPPYHSHDSMSLCTIM
ncbi:hypothetical protein C2S52_002681 [Perilla frutescens var. hirtella]|nr:hypothetical protein C2S51_012766 [Perilla frutescens var. frutescens]KAH6792204.1 hypothetical protein C2S52_002681 [Perilla frutescens var. hirtella]